MKTFRIHSLALLALGTTGCLGSVQPFQLDLSGDWSPGQRGVTRWQISDGLCPGLGGGCGLDMRLAEGFEFNTNIDGVRGLPLTATTRGGIETVGLVRVDPDGELYSALRLRTTAPGQAEVEVSDTNGVVDVARFNVARPTRIECGSWPGGGGWRMTDLRVESTLRVPRRDNDDEVSVEIACRVSDASGPIHAGNAMHWRRITGTNVGLTPGGFTPASGDAAGGRMYHEAAEAGTSVFEVTLGELRSEVTIIVE